MTVELLILQSQRLHLIVTSLAINRSLSFFSFFFFQAEDGIRDYKVTGVQTCALPICPCPTATAPHRAAATAHRWPGRPRQCRDRPGARKRPRSEEHTSELQSPCNLVCRLLLEKKKK